MGKRWTAADINRVAAKGFKCKIQGKQHQQQEKALKTNANGSEQKAKIEFTLLALVQQKAIEGYESEYQFDKKRKFRFDWAIPSLMLAIEYEGLMSDKSGHTTVTGYTKDCIKYNLAATQGWKVLRYTALNVQNILGDIEKILTTM